jgi:hypothetical protein
MGDRPEMSIDAKGQLNETPDSRKRKMTALLSAFVCVP